MRTTIVVPCYNEADRLDARSFTRFARTAGDIRLLFVNDGSRDRTANVLRELVAQFPEQLGLLNLVQNQGKAEAVRQGVCSAILEGCGAVGYWDADLATPLTDIFNFRDVLLRRPEVQLVVGSRMPLLGHDIRRHPLRRLLGRTFATVASFALGLPIYDTQCGAKLFRVTPSTAELFSRPFGSRWIFDVELLARWINRSASCSVVRPQIFELPLERWEDVPGSKLKPRHFVQALHEMMAIYWHYRGPLAKRWEPLPFVLSIDEPSHAQPVRRAA